MGTPTWHVGEADWMSGGEVLLCSVTGWEADSREGKEEKEGTERGQQAEEQRRGRAQSEEPVTSGIIRSTLHL